MDGEGVPVDAEVVEELDEQGGIEGSGIEDGGVLLRPVCRGAEDRLILLMRRLH